MSQKILAITEQYAGGESQATQSLLAAVQELHTEVKEVHLPRLQKTGTFHYVSWLLSSTLAALQVIHQQKEYQHIYTTTFIGALAAVLYKPFRPLVVSFHYHGNRIPPQDASLPWFRRWTQSFKHSITFRIHAFAWSHVDVFISPSEHIQEKLERAFTLGKRSVVIPNGVDTHCFTPLSDAARDALRKRYHIPQRAFVCAVVSRIDPQKKILETISLVEEVQRSCRRQLLLIIASPSQGSSQTYSEEVKAALQTREVPHYIVFDFAKIEQIYQMSDCVITSSAQEVFPLVLLEAAACGVPFFAQKNGVVETYLEEIDPQLILADERAEAARQIVAQTHKRKLSEKLRQFAVNHTWRASAVALLYNLAQREP